jgi:hypothetical protein
MDAAAALGNQGGALSKMKRQIFDARPSRVGGMKPFLAQGVGVHEKPVKENLNSAFHRSSYLAV